MKIKITMAILLSGLSACKSASVKTNFKGCVIEENPGFIKPHSVRIYSTGKPKPNESNLYRKRTQSESAALICAQTYITQKYSDGKNILTNGVIQEIVFDSQDNCIIDYKVTHKSIYHKK